MTRSDRSRWIAQVAVVACLTSCGGGGGGEPYNPGGGTPVPGINPPPASTYVRSFGSRGNDHAYALAALPDGGLAIGGLLARGTSAEVTTSWLGVLDAGGFPISEQRVVSRDAARGYERFTSKAVEGQGALFAGTVLQTQTGSDIVVRFHSANGEMSWERELDSGRWSGNVDISGAGLDDSRPQLFPAFDANGTWQGVWVYAETTGNVVDRDGDGDQRIVHRSSVTVWFLGVDGSQVSRSRLVYVNAPARADVHLRSAAVLDTGSLALALHESGTDESDERLVRTVVRRVGQDGTIGGPFIELPSHLQSAELASTSGALVAFSRGRVARLDISAQRVLWETNLDTVPAAFEWVTATTVDRGGTAMLAVGGFGHAGESVVLQVNPATGAQLRNCRLPEGLRLLSLRGRASGNLRSLLASSEGLRSANLGDDCQPIPGSETNLGESFAARWFGSSNYSGIAVGGGATLSQNGEFVHENTPARVRRTDAATTTVFDIGLGSDIATDEGFYLLTADSRGQVGFGSETLIQRRGANGSLVRASAFPGRPWDMAADVDGRFWTTAEAAGPVPGGECTDGVVVLQADGRADCRRVVGRSLSEWALSPGPDGSMWAASSAIAEALRFASDGTVTSHASMCRFEDLDVGPDQARVSFEYSDNRICHDGNGGRSWTRVLNASAFGGQLEVERDGNIKAVAASDGGVALMFSVRQRGEIPGVRSNANIIGDSDVALLKLDAAGNPQWLRVFGGAGDETSNQLVRMADGGYALLGTSNSFDALTPGSVDLFVVRTGPDGHVARTADGGDACQACLGSITGELLFELLGGRETAAFEAASAPLQVTVTALTLPEADGVTEAVPGETNARQCTGNVTDVQEAANTGPSPPDGGNEIPEARFTVVAQYGGAGANPISNRDPAHFDARASTPASNITRYEWDFEDDGVYDAEGIQQTHTYDTRGTKTARLRVTHANGRTGEAFQSFQVDAASGYFIRVLPVHNENTPGNRIERIDGAINCFNRSDGSVGGVCFANGSNAPGAESVLRATPVAGSRFTSWVGCDLTREQAEGPPLCVISGDPDGGERHVEAHFEAGARALVTVIMTGATAAQGVVHSQGHILNCSGTCSAEFPVGTVVELHALVAAEGDFLRFENCDRVVQTICYVDLGASGRTVTAIYR
jgi:outer membrane protein assembly factor BamB